MAKYSFPAGETAESIATALSILSGRRIRKDQVIVEPTEDAGEYLVTVYENAELATRVIPFLDEHGSIPTSMGELCLVGHKTNRSPAMMDLRQHGQLIGATESGKSSLLHKMLAHATRCPDCVIWVGGVWKLYDFVSEWLEAYLNSGLLPPIDWVANGHEDVCEMMAAFLRGAAYRTNTRKTDRTHLPYMILVLDEVTYIVNNKHVKGIVHGEEMTASQMLAGIARGTAGARMYEWLATQRDTFENLGVDGGTTAAQMGFAFVFRIRDQGTVGRVTGDYTLPNPTGRGQCWADLGPESPIYSLRIPYPHTMDTSKPALHDGPRLDQVSWARRNIPHVLDEGTANAAGPAYADRHRYVTEEYLDYLRTTKTLTPQPIGGTIMDSMIGPIDAEEYLAAETLFNQRVAARQNDHANGNGASASLPEYAPVSEATVLADYRPRKQRILDIVQGANGPMVRGEIITELERMGDNIGNAKVVTNLCGELARDGTIRKTDDDPPKYYAV